MDFWNNIPEQCVLEVIIGQCRKPQEISIEFYQDLNDELNPPGDSPFLEINSELRHQFVVNIL